MPTTGDPLDDTVETSYAPSLSDDLLAVHDEPAPDATAVAPTAAPPAGEEQDEDDEYFEPQTRRRSRLTTGLLVALIFLLGMLAGVLLGRALASDPAPQVVYVLNDAGSTAAPVTPTAGPTSSR